MVEPICQNTPASVLRTSKKKFNAVVQGVTIPLESLNLSKSGRTMLKGGATAGKNDACNSKKENNYGSMLGCDQLSSSQNKSFSAKGARKSCVVKLSKQAVRKLKEE